MQTKGIHTEGIPYRFLKFFGGGDKEVGGSGFVICIGFGCFFYFGQSRV